MTEFTEIEYGLFERLAVGSDVGPFDVAAAITGLGVSVRKADAMAERYARENE
jgi:hypothetical protein